MEFQPNWPLWGGVAITAFVVVRGLFAGTGTAPKASASTTDAAEYLREMLAITGSKSVAYDYCVTGKTYAEAMRAELARLRGDTIEGATDEIDGQ